MRRAESLNEISASTPTGSRHNKDTKEDLEMTTTTRQKTGNNHSTSSSTMSSESSIGSHYKRHTTPLSSSNKSYSHSKLHHLDSGYSSGSIYRNSSYLRLSPHLQLEKHSSVPISGVSNSPTGHQPPWPLAPESLYYTRSQYGLNKLHQQLYQQATLQAFASVQNLNAASLSRQYSDQQSFSSSQSDPDLEALSDEGSSNNSSNKKESSKRFKRVLSAINFPRKIKQYQADKKRFNIYNIPVETREQLKHIYVY